MTGFARTESVTPGGVLVWEIRSINHRYLEVLLKLPDAFRPLETELRQLATARLGRGRVEANLSVRGADSGAAGPGPNLEVVRQVVAQLHELQRELPQLTPPNALDLLRWPGVLQSQELDAKALLPQAAPALELALAELNAARGREGARIHDMLDRRCTEIGEHVAAVEARLPEVHTRIRERLQERITALGVMINPERLEQELALLAQKLDVSEELDRLRAHVAEFRDNVASDAPVGRRLDFLIQELNREANTLASKSADAETTRHAVDIKVLLEQIREQIQNVE
jgi:uncharacterized protein (TIGR00255 family)